MRSIVLIFVAFFILNNLCFSQDLQLELVTDRTEVLEFEPIKMLAVLINDSDTEVLLTSFGVETQTNLKINVQDESGEFLIPDFGITVHVNAFFKIVFPPKDSMITAIALDRWFGSADGFYRYNYFYLSKKYLTAGKYLVHAEFNFEDEVIKSNTIEINVLPPVLPEDVLVLEKLREVAELYTKNKSEYFNHLLDILETYPQNTYSFLAYSQLVVNYKEEYVSESEYKKQVLKLAQHFPDRMITYSLCTIANRRIEDKAFTEKIGNIIINSPYRNYRNVGLKERERQYKYLPLK